MLYYLSVLDFMTNITKRSHKFNLKVSKIKTRLIDTLAFSSKNVWNCGVYFCKHWYILHNLIVQFYISTSDWSAYYIKKIIILKTINYNSQL